MIEITSSNQGAWCYLLLLTEKEQKPIVKIYRMSDGRDIIYVYSGEYLKRPLDCQCRQGLFYYHPAEQGIFKEYILE